MTENKKRGLRKPLQMGLIAAALACVMCVTAAAANPEAVKELWHNITMSVTILRDDGDMVIVETQLPEVSVDDVDDRTILTINGETADITDALNQDGEYVGEWDNDCGTGKITVRADKTWELEASLLDGTKVGSGYAGEYGFTSVEQTNPDDDACIIYTFTDDESVTDATYLPPEG